ncbi:MAG: hypothetical protein ACT4P3_03020 [Betaproteobacteria bacterium]
MRSEIAGVVTTDGDDGTGRSMMRVHAASSTARHAGARFAVQALR